MTLPRKQPRSPHLRNPALRGSNRSLANLGFTLTELLIGLAVIAILMAILLPAIGKVRAKAQSSGCVSNLRQLGTAFQVYQADNGGKSLVAYDLDSKKFWYQYLLGRNIAGDVVSYNYMDSKKVPACPAWDGNAAWGGYGMTDLYLWNPGRRVRSEERFFMNKLKIPSQWPLFMDADFAVIYSLDNPQEEANERQRFAPRHLGYANVLMADMHIETARYGDKQWHQAELNKGSNF